MNNKKTRNILLSLISLGIVVFIIISFIGVSMLNKKSQSMVQLKIKSAQMDAQLINLSQAKKDVDKYKDFNAIAATVIPKDKNQVQAIADIFQMADQAGILLQSVTFPNSTLGSKPTTTPTSSTGGQSSASTGTSANTQTAISQAKPFAAVPGLYSLELTITPQTSETVPPDKQVTFPKFISFLSAIENSRRTAQITQVTIQPIALDGSNGEFINFTLGINIFIKP